MATLRMNCVAAVNSRVVVDHRFSTMHLRPMMVVGVSPIGGRIKVQHHMGSLRIGDPCGFGHHDHGGFNSSSTSGGNFAAAMCTPSSSDSDESDTFDEWESDTFDELFKKYGQDSSISGGIEEVERFKNDPSYENLARFAVDEHNKKQKQNGVLEFNRLLRVRTQVVAGAMVYLTLEASDAGGQRKVYDAKVWDRPWLNFRQLQQFRHIGDA